MDVFEKTQTQESSKLKQKTQTQAKNSNSSKKPSKTQAIKLNYGQFHSNYQISLGNKLKFANQNHTLCQDFQYFWLKVWYLSGKLKLKTQFPANSFGLFAETWSNF